MNIYIKSEIKNIGLLGTDIIYQLLFFLDF